MLGTAKTGKLLASSATAKTAAQKVRNALAERLHKIKNGKNLKDHLTKDTDSYFLSIQIIPASL